jgi:16S rRNA (adenine1518-N6/adenine1519-N6)-dimethyltransferase
VTRRSVSAPPGGARRAPIARRRFGQHFLEPAWVDKLLRAIDPQPDQTFIEIGPGRGALTRPLATRARAVVAYEIDRDLAAALRAEAIPNVTIVEGDVLEHLEPEPEPEPGSRHASPRPPNAIRVAGNLPYNVASPILFRLADLYAAGLPIADATVMLQREVAERLVASPGTGAYGVLSVLMQHVADADIVLKLPPGAFRPAPKVHSAVVRLRFHAPRPPVADPAVFVALVQAVFTRRRKTLENALGAYRPPPGIGNAGAASAAGEREAAGSGRSGSDADKGRAVTSSRRPRGPARAAPRPAVPRDFDGRRRPETLTVAEFARLADFYADKGE